MFLSFGFLLCLLSALLAAPFLTWHVTSNRFHQHIADSEHSHKKDDEWRPAPPVAPYRTPLIGDVVSALRDPAKYVSGIFAKYGWRRPLRVRAGTRFFTLVANPEHIVAIFRAAARQAGSKPATSMALRRVFGATSRVARLWDADDSGIAAQPRRGSAVPDHLRVHFWTAHTAQEFLSGPHLQALNERFVVNVKRQIDADLGVGVGAETAGWVDRPDLYAFVQSVVGRSATDTLMGPRLLELSPGLLDDFRVFDANLLNFLFGKRRWMARAAYEARDRLLEAVARWHGEAQEKAGASVDRIAPEDPEFDAYFGSKLLRARQGAMMKMGLGAHDKAALDVGLMFAINSNVLRAIFWFLFHTLRDADLRSDLLAEARRCRRADGLFDVAALVRQPLLQSTFAEVCRFYVAIGVSRTVNHAPLQLGRWAVPVGETLSVFNREAAFNDEAWAAAGRAPTGAGAAPLATFDARRFLVPTHQQDGEPGQKEDVAPVEFSLDGLAGCWLPFGGGQRMCPGRHFAKSEMLGTFAMLLTDYELELAEGVSDVQPDMRWYPTGTLPPKGQVPFRLRRRTDTQI